MAYGSRSESKSDGGMNAKLWTSGGATHFGAEETGLWWVRKGPGREAKEQ